MNVVCEVWALSKKIDNASNDGKNHEKNHKLSITLAIITVLNNCEQRAYSWWRTYSDLV